jgi:hypothetical protein
MAYIAQVGAPLMVVAALIGACGRSEESRRAGAEAAAADSAAAAAAAASAERRVSNVMIGRRLGSNDRITEPTFQFAPLDTVYVSVGVEGATGAGTLTAAWRSQNGEIVQQSSEPVRPAGENTAFHLFEPKGLKPGTYKVILFLGEDSVDTKVFAVQK